MNRSDFRKGGLQGRQASVEEKDGKWRGVPRGSFFGRKPSISAAKANVARRKRLMDIARTGQRIALPGRSRRKRYAQRVAP